MSLEKSSLIWWLGFFTGVPYCLKLTENLSVWYVLVPFFISLIILMTEPLSQEGRK